MGYGRYVGRVGALAVATRMTVSIGVAVLVVMTTVVPATTRRHRQARLSRRRHRMSLRAAAQRRALVLGGTTVPTPDQVLPRRRQGSLRRRRLIRVRTSTYVAVTAPMDVLAHHGDRSSRVARDRTQSVWGPGGAAWPDEPLWKLSGFFDLTFDQSVPGGVTVLEQAIADAPRRTAGDLRLLAGRDGREPSRSGSWPSSTRTGPRPPTSTSCSAATSTCPTAASRPGSPVSTSRSSTCHFNGPAPTDTQFHTVEIIKQYDGFSDFPLYPLNLISTGNALLGARLQASARPRTKPGRPGDGAHPHRRPATPTTTSSRPMTCRCSTRCVSWECPSR